MQKLRLLQIQKKGGDSSDSDDDDSYSSSSSLDYGVKGVIAEDDYDDDYDEEEKQDEVVINNDDKESPQQPTSTTPTDDNDDAGNDGNDVNNDNDDKMPGYTRELSPPQITTADILVDEQEDVAEIIAANNEEIEKQEEQSENKENDDIIQETEPLKSQTPPPPTPDVNNKNDDADDFKEYSKQTAKKKRKKNKKKLTVEEFKSVSLEDLIENDVDILDNYDIARKICKFFDSQFDDTDTVCMVAEEDKQPSISYWVKGQYVRKHKNICGKHILVYRACKHTPAKEPILSKSKFEAYIKKISIEYENDSVNKIADLMDNKFGDGCHYAKSTTKKPAYDIYCRFSDKYECGFKLPSGSYVIAWRR